MTYAKAGPLEHDPEKWVPVFGKRSCSTKKLGALIALLTIIGGKVVHNTGIV